MPFIAVDEESFDDIVEREFEKGHTVILKFGSAYCDSCQLMEFELEEVHDRVTKVSILDIDVGECLGLMQRFEIEQVPTTLIFQTASSQLLYKNGIMLADDMIDIILKER
ncbi:thioredoxin family protein [Sulfurimonas paralvinellae]|uniref:Thioredoxin family protein n=1 Tax=Sulfurimonas paralvinellae TaxID=317658 RepID=A0A7M1B665_9BACT|nr:thioredoxin family protein [Sulfurimonas paralvinellae]QOP45191.1 thioredoxin family protein [Sulfurimonas paralvinellae]